VYSERLSPFWDFQLPQRPCACSPALFKHLIHHVVANFMSQPPPPTSSSSKTPTTTASSSDFKGIFEKALKAYNKKTKQDLTAHPLSTQLQGCDSPAAILNILQDQVDQFKQSRSGDERLQRWLNPTINVLYAFSETLGEGISLVNMNRSVDDLALIPTRQVFSPAKVIFAGAGVLLLVGLLFTREGSCDIAGS
jgi:hypothetical protein